MIHSDERLTISPSVAIEAITIAGGTEAVWHAWRDGTPIATEPSDRTTLYRHYLQSTLAATDELLRERPVDRERTGLILATTKGDIDRAVQWMRHADGIREKPSAPDPPTLGGEAASLAARLELGGPVWAVSTACSSGIVALIDAAICLLDGEAENMLAVGLDVAGDFVRDGFAALKAISPTRCRPFDVNRDGLALGSAGAACLLGKTTPTRRPLCLLSGWGVASDAVHMTAPDRNAGGLIAAMLHALAMANLVPSEIGVIVAHGTGTRYNDAMEAVAIRKVFLESVSPPTTGENRGPMVTALKGLIGHTLGASGVIETALATRIFAEQIVPPVTNLQAPEWADLNLVTLKSRAPHRPIRHIMKVASGFGGLNAAVVLSSPDAREHA